MSIYNVITNNKKAEFKAKPISLRLEARKSNDFIWDLKNNMLSQKRTEQH